MIEEYVLLPASFQLKCITQMRVVAMIVRCKEQGSLITNQPTFLAQGIPRSLNFHSQGNFGVQGVVHT